MRRRPARRKPRRLRQGKSAVGAIYARYSHVDSHSAEDQVRRCRDFADANGIEVPDELVFVDRAVPGRRRRRDGFDQLQAALVSNRFDVLLVFKTSRLYRKAYRSLQFVQEEIVERGKRCVFVCSGIDTSDGDRWETLLHINAMMDDLGSRTGSAHIQAAQDGLFEAERVYGCLAYGYKGEPVPGESTRAGKTRCRIAIDEDQSTWVRRTFAWFVDTRVSLNECARKLNEAGAPLPPRCTTGRWTKTAVRLLLSNARYRGFWECGRSKKTYLNKKDYDRSVRLEKARKSKQIERLRLIDDATWYRAQERLSAPSRPGGRRPKDRDCVHRPRLLNGLLFCRTHQRALQVGGAHAGSFVCATCSEVPQPALVSYVNRRRATEVICQTCAELVRGDPELVDRIVAACRDAAESAQRPDPKQLAVLKEKARTLSNRIEFIFRNPGERPEEMEENSRALREARHERDVARAEIATLESAGRRPAAIPEREQVAQKVEELALILERAAHSDDPDDCAAARHIIELITGGRILLTQAGIPEPKRGWLRGTFQVNLVKPVLDGLSCPVVAPGEAREVSVEFRRLTKYVALAQQVKDLWDDGLEFKQIAAHLEVSVSTVVRAFTEWHHQRGQAVPPSNTKAVVAFRKAKWLESNGDFSLGLIA